MQILAQVPAETAKRWDLQAKPQSNRVHTKRGGEAATSQLILTPGVTSCTNTSRCLVRFKRTRHKYQFTVQHGQSGYCTAQTPVRRMGDVSLGGSRPASRSRSRFLHRDSQRAKSFQTQHELGGIGNGGQRADSQLQNGTPMPREVLVEFSAIQ